MPNEKPIPQQIPIEKIHDLPGVIDPKQPEKAYGTLVSSILVNGLREPVILRPLENGEYQLVHGYRRRRAAELAKLKEVSAFVYDMTEKEAQEYRRAQAVDPKAPIPGKLIEEAAESKAATAEKKAEEKQPTKATEPQEKKAEPAEKKTEAAPPVPAKAQVEKPTEKKAEAAAPPKAKPEEKKAEVKAEAEKLEKPADAPAEKKSAELPKDEKKAAEAPAAEQRPEDQRKQKKYSQKDQDRKSVV